MKNHILTIHPRYTRLKHQLLGLALGCAVAGTALPARADHEDGRREKRHDREVPHRITTVNHAATQSSAAHDSSHDGSGTGSKSADDSRDVKSGDLEKHGTDLNKADNGLKIGRLGR
jgi:hypothetical protein